MFRSHTICKKTDLLYVVRKNHNLIPFKIPSLSSQLLLLLLFNNWVIKFTVNEHDDLMIDETKINLKYIHFLLTLSSDIIFI